MCCVEHDGCDSSDATGRLQTDFTLLQVYSKKKRKEQRLEIKKGLMGRERALLLLKLLCIKV